MLTYVVLEQEESCKTDSLAGHGVQSHPGTLEFRKEAGSSYYMGSMDPTLVEKLEDPAFNLVIENHEFGMPVEHYDSWPVLKENYKILTTSKDRCPPPPPPCPSTESKPLCEPSRLEGYHSALLQLEVRNTRLRVQAPMSVWRCAQARSGVRVHHRVQAPPLLWHAVAPREAAL